MTLSCALVSTVHDPDERLLPKTRQLWSSIQSLYGTVALVCSPDTAPNTLSFLQSAGAYVVVPEDIPVGWEHLGLTRTRCLAVGAQLGLPAMHFCDWDRLLHWIEFYPNELGYVLARAYEHDFTVLGRTQQAFDSHPPVQRQTEGIANHVFSRAIGRPMDITAGSRLLTLPAAEYLAAHSVEVALGTDAEWPLLIWQADNLTLGYVPCQGLEFETADRYAEEIARSGGLATWMATVLDRPESWALRLRIALAMVEAVARLQ